MDVLFLIDCSEYPSALAVYTVVAVPLLPSKCPCHTSFATRMTAESLSNGWTSCARLSPSFCTICGRRASFASRSSSSSVSSMLCVMSAAASVVPSG